MAPIAPIALWGDAGSRLQLPNNERGLHFRSWCDRRKPIRQCLALLTSKWVEVQVGATRSYAIWAVTA